MSRAKKQHLTQRKDKRYCCVYHGIQFMGRTEDEALQARKDYKAREQVGETPIKKITVAAYIAKWLPLHKADVSQKCYADYAKQLQALANAIGNMKMNSVTVDDAAHVWNHYQGYSASTIKRARMLYISLFDSGIENGYCRRNPFRGRFAQPPKAPTGSHRALTQEEITLILTTPHRVQLGAMLMLYAGLRRGEALALTSDDITPDEIIVNKAVRFEGNTHVITSPKTGAGIRRVPILSPLRPFLNVTGLVMPSARNQLMTETAFTRAWNSYLHALSLSAGHPVNIRPHDLRHTFCTLIMDAGISITQAMSWMGHSDEKMILHIYDHLTESRNMASVNQVEKLLNHMQNDMQKNRRP